ncbi:glioma pathogenesis-related protein 1-like [Heterodontus francisci]|uniref:glioma pathogenesis-related protein 1-like n=1 Tax=Heterodontus francisci TaxID=7792 RepID=UPI00355BBE97
MGIRMWWRRLFSRVSLEMLFYFAVFGVESSIDIDNEDFIKECIRGHNLYRSKVEPPASNMLYMSWDRILAQAALEWSRNCMFKHNSDLKVPGKLHPVFTTIGENIFVTGGSNLNVTRAITAWYNEVQFYDYFSQTCTGVCGHYTQVVWASSYKVGCAVHTCPSGIADFSSATSTIFVCDYGPPGNYPTLPYLKGEACSECFNDRCENKLCRNRTLEMSSDSNSVCDHFCIAVLAIRPLSLIVIIAGVYVVQKKYPNMFAYL